MEISSIESPAFLKELDVEQLENLASEIRSFLIGQLSKTGGHLGSNLGVCELTIALHKIYNSPEDQLIWDIGHQTYVHKILTGRSSMFPFLRKKSGMSGFIHRGESVHDIWEAGHSSTSLSAALGHAIVRDNTGRSGHVIAIIGDGALTGGMAMEALNHLGDSGRKVTVVLNDNGMSISPNIGALKNFFADDDLHFRKTFFEKIGIHYLGPVNGHCISELIDCFQEAKLTDSPVFIHVRTEKGKGWLPAENDLLSKGHGVAPYDPYTGEPTTTDITLKDYSQTVADALLDIAETNFFTVITPAMIVGSRLVEFGDRYPDRLIDTGIAEQHAVTLAAGMANAGGKVFLPIYSTFLQRGYDQVVHDVCRQNLNVAFGIDRAGFSGADGDSHHGVFDIAFLRSLPNMILMMPSCEVECNMMTRFALEYSEGPIALRYPRGKVDDWLGVEPIKKLEIGKWQVLKNGTDAAIITFGPILRKAMNTAESLAECGLSIMVINARFIKPLDEALLESLFKQQIPILTLEESVLAGGFGSSVLEYAADHGYSGSIIRRLGLDDIFYGIGSDEELRTAAGLTENVIAEQCTRLVLEREHA
ncbi:1-deoxy-D-xylulose-5-phosphate synthase [Aciduricibacillus chroicocephali]|uniref:1-deoxy-D-xylulose-5-phosphate synthase n=1 Tax=Aciduricibacillus chroicocephali TaxID=3054939 RepID=A0ABY9KTD3_9BACI|nr:1-deoxy-D-xylulose-5-phosphate synthase [Bacillaceae bacterium 44XB]